MVVKGRRRRKVNKGAVKKNVCRAFSVFVSPDWKVIETLYNQRTALLITAGEVSKEEKEGLIKITIK